MNIIQFIAGFGQHYLANLKKRVVDQMLIELAAASANGSTHVVEFMLKFQVIRDNAAANNNNALTSAAWNEEHAIVLRLIELPSVREHLPVDVHPHFRNTVERVINEALSVYRLKQLMRSSLEVAYSAYSDLKPSETMAFPEEMDSEYATLFAMGIISQFKSSPGAPNPIMCKVLSYLLHMEDNRPSVCIELVAKRKLPQALLAEQAFTAQ
ncbi:MAG: hypothetical protein AB7I18_11520 [Candidatus Berkiella sp.]